MTEVGVAETEDALKAVDGENKFPFPGGSERIGEEDADSEIKNKKSCHSKVPLKPNHGVKSNSKIRRRRRWKPYFKLSFSERQKKDEKCSRRAIRIHEERLACGISLAPYNTTQFLMKDQYDQQHRSQDMLLSNGDHHQLGGVSLSRNSSSEGCIESPVEDYLQKEFEDTYEEMHNEFLNSRSKSDLAWNYMDMEDKIEALEKSLKKARLENEGKQRTFEFNVASELEKIRVFREEIEKLTQDINLLRAVNFELSLCLPGSSE